MVSPGGLPSFPIPAPLAAAEGQRLEGHTQSQQQRQQEGQSAQQRAKQRGRGHGVWREVGAGLRPAAVRGGQACALRLQLQQPQHDEHGVPVVKKVQLFWRVAPERAFCVGFISQLQPFACCC